MDGRIDMRTIPTNISKRHLSPWASIGCLRVKKDGGSIFVAPKAKINHTGCNTVDSRFIEEIEFSRNWHWIWSKFYFNKKHFGFFKAIKVCVSTYFTSLLKFSFYLIIKNSFKKKIYFNRASGFYNALLGRASWYRPNLKDRFIEFKNIDNP